MKELQKTMSPMLAGHQIDYGPVKRYTNFFERLGRKYGMGAVSMQIDKKTGEVIMMTTTTTTPSLPEASDNSSVRKSAKGKRREPEEPAKSKYHKRAVDT